MQLVAIRIPVAHALNLGIGEGHCHWSAPDQLRMQNSTQFTLVTHSTRMYHLWTKDEKGSVYKYKREEINDSMEVQLIFPLITKIR